MQSVNQNYHFFDLVVLHFFVSNIKILLNIYYMYRKVMVTLFFLKISIIIIVQVNAIIKQRMNFENNYGIPLPQYIISILISESRILT